MGVYTVAVATDGFSVIADFARTVFRNVTSAPLLKENQYILVNDSGSRTDICTKVGNGTYDMAIGSLSITPERLRVVSMTVPFQNANLVVITKVSSNWNQNVFFQPFEPALWHVIIFFVLAMVLLLTWLEKEHIFDEHNLERCPHCQQIAEPAANGQPDTQGQSSPSRQSDTIFSGAMGTRLRRFGLGFGRMLWWVHHSILYAHDKDDVTSFFGRTASAVWLVGVVILFAAYQANLAAILTSSQLEPRVKNVESALWKSKGMVGVQNSTWISEQHEQLGLKDRMTPLSSDFTQWVELLRNGSIESILTQFPHAARFANEHGCKNYDVVGLESQTGRFAWGGWAWAFFNESGLLDTFSAEIVKLQFGGGMEDIQKRSNIATKLCPPREPKDQIDIEDMKNLLIFTGVTFISVWLVSLVLWWKARERSPMATTLWGGRGFRGYWRLFGASGGS